MPLISCPECGQQISDRASSCPHCGLPNESLATPQESQPTSFLQSQTANTVVKGLTAWALVAWIGKLLFALAGLAFLAYFLTR